MTMLDRMARAMTRYCAVSSNGRHVVYDNERGFLLDTAAILNSDADARDEALRLNVLSALSALREPTPEMVDAGEAVLDDTSDYSWCYKDRVPEVWRAMIDRAAEDS